MITEMNYWRTVSLTTLVGAVYIVAGWISFSYPPDYLPFSPLWSVLMIAGGVSTLLFLAYPHTWLAGVSGTLVVSTSIFRGLAIESTLGLRFWDVLNIGPEQEPLRSSFAIAGLTWFLLGVLIWVGWPFAVAMLRERSGVLDE